MRKSGQVWAIDFIISVIIFFVAIALIIFAWNYSTQQNQDQASLNSIENIALSTSDGLIKSPGIPEEWNETSVITIGLASQENVLNSSKVDMFMSLSYDKTRSLLAISNYGFYFELRYLNNSVIQSGGQNITKGLYPFQNASVVIPVERYVIYRNMPSKLEFFLWRP